ncbi:MAG: fucose isomerase [Lachnospiraceae bacterium]|nr:fucose isomerase [Lachnospiraceae bacterium]
MSGFCPLFVPAGVGTFHMETAHAFFHTSSELLKQIDPAFLIPDDILLSVDLLEEWLRDKHPDLVVFQNNTFANAAYMETVLRETDCPVLLWTLREPKGDGGRLKLNSLTGAYSAANMHYEKRGCAPLYVFGSPDEEAVRDTIRTVVRAARLRKEMQSLRMAAVGEPPQGFGFGRALEKELKAVFGASLISVPLPQILDRAKSFSPEDGRAYLEKSALLMNGLDRTPEKNLVDYGKLYKAYHEFVTENEIGALASRCWPDLFTEYGTPNCAVLSMLNDDGVAAACEADMYGALSMWMGMRLSESPVFFGDPVAMDEEENSITYWHCGACACGLARNDTGAVVGVHPNRKIGPAMDFGCESFGDATVFRVGRTPDGHFRFFVFEGQTLDKPKQYIGTSIVVRPDNDAGTLVRNSVRAGFEPHFAVIKGHHAETLSVLAEMLGLETIRY